MKDFAKSIHVGNSNTVSEYNAEIQRLTRKAEQLHRMGQGKSAMEVEKQIEKLGKELRELGNQKVGNSVTEKEFNSEADLRRWCIDHNYTYTPIGGGYYRLEDDKPGSHKPDIEAHVKSGNSKVGNALKYTNLEEAKKMCQQMNDSLAPDAALRHFRHVYEKDGVYYVMETGEAVAKGMKRVGNSKVGNAIKKFGMGSLVIADGHKAVVFKETVEQGPNGIPFGWVTVRFVEGPWKGQTDEYYDYDLKKA